VFGPIENDTNLNEIRGFRIGLLNYKKSMPLQNSNETGLFEMDVFGGALSVEYSSFIFTSKIDYKDSPRSPDVG
jgi:hypothetical protein